MRADITALGGFMIPELSVPKVDPMKREWYLAGFLSLFWIAGLGTYGMGFFSRAAASGRSASVLEVAIFVCTLLLPVMCVWAAAFAFNWSRRIERQTQDLTAAVNDLHSALALASPATAEMVVTSVSAAAKSAIKAEQNRMNSALRVLSEDQRQVSDAVRRLLAARETEQTAMAELVETARSVTNEAAHAAEAADAARATHLSRVAQMALERDTQDALPFDETPDAALAPEDVSWADITRALNFPTDEADTATFKAIRKVMPNRTMSTLLYKSEAILALLAEEGIYMDDLQGAPADPEDWRSFASGTRGPAVDGLGAVRDPAALALAKGRIRTDAAFHEKGLDFLRAFDSFLQEFCDQANTRDLIDLGTTRTGRAFQLLARVTGAFI